VTGLSSAQLRAVRGAALTGQQWAQMFRVAVSETARRGAGATQLVANDLAGVSSAHPVWLSAVLRAIALTDHASPQGRIQVPAIRRTNLTRCAWAQSPLLIAYHDEEWGRPVHDDRVLFEFLILEGAQAGLSWETILKKRDGYRRAFAGFDPEKVARFTDDRRVRLMTDAGIVRNRLKISSAVTNARAFLAIQREFGSFDTFVWPFVGGAPRVTRPRSGEIPARTDESDALSKALATRGFKFVGSTICYAFMQAVGMVDDHTVDCFRARRIRPRRSFAAKT
jgi:DNA-3-methyladenine glycosylase I